MASEMYFPLMGGKGRNGKGIDIYHPYWSPSEHVNFIDICEVRRFSRGFPKGIEYSHHGRKPQHHPNQGYLRVYIHQIDGKASLFIEDIPKREVNRNISMNRISPIDSYHNSLQQVESLREKWKQVAKQEASFLELFEDDEE